MKTCIYRTPRLRAMALVHCITLFTSALSPCKSIPWPSGALASIPSMANGTLIVPYVSKTENEQWRILAYSLACVGIAQSLSGVKGWVCIERNIFSVPWGFRRGDVPGTSNGCEHEFSIVYRRRHSEWSSLEVISRLCQDV